MNEARHPSLARPDPNAPAGSSAAKPLPWWLRIIVGQRPLRTLGRALSLIVGCWILFKFVLIPIRVTGVSMVPTYPDHSIKVVNRLAYTWSKPHRGDIVAVRMTGKWFMYVKRIIGLPGETIGIHGGVVSINGEVLEEPYVHGRAPWVVDPVKLRNDEYYVIGDNRALEQDEHTFGKIQEVQIVGKTMF